RAHLRAATFIEDAANREEVVAILAARNRVDASPEVIRRTLDGQIKVAPNGTARVSDRYLLIGRKGAPRPDPTHAAWLYAQMVRWGQAPLSAELLSAAKAVFRPDLYANALSDMHDWCAGEAVDDIGAFAGPAFDPSNIAGHLAAWEIRR